MENVNTNNGLVPKYTASQLVSGDFMGVDLKGVYYRENNIKRVNNTVRVSLEKKHTLYIYQVIDDEDMTQICRKLSNTTEYVRREFKGFTTLLVSAPDGWVDVISGIINEYSDDFTLTEIINFEDNPLDRETQLLKCYELAKHTLDEKTTRNQKEFSASDTKKEYKGLGVSLVKDFVMTETKS